jgi:TonB-dependent SusC/RagA subfamily outer membrane receptor
MRRSALAFLVTLVAMSLGTPASAQTGSVTGRVVIEDTGAPMPSAQVFIVGTSRGSLTNSAGRFTIDQVPAGQIQVGVTVLGYAPVTRSVTVTAGAAATVNVSLRLQAVSLDAIVVTGTAGQTRVREVGISMERVTAATMIEPPRDVEAMLQGKVLGVNINSTGGSIGGGSLIRLRGNSSASQGNQPLIYIDGVRLRSAGYPRNQPPTGFDGRGSDGFGSTMNEINPNDIERVEIIKGPAATTLYGTEAAAGVIQIFTKRGAAGSVSWTFQTDQGLMEPRKFGPPNEPFMRMESVLRTGWTQGYLAQVSGGVEAAQYFVSVRRDLNEGVFANDSEHKTAIRGNLQFVPRPGLTINWNTSYVDNDVSETPTGNNSNGVTAIALRAHNSALGATWREDIHRILEWEILNYHTNFTTGFSATYLPIQNLTNRLTVGFNRLDADMRSVRNFGFILSPDGELSNQRWSAENLTLDYVSNLALQLKPTFRTTLSVGTQYNSEAKAEAATYGTGLPGPSVPTISSAANRTGFETRSRVATGGFFGQAQFAFLDRYFITAGLRLDGSSAFGTDFGIQAYPKLDGSYVLSDESFWPEGLGTLRLRAAYGEAGRAPGAFDSYRTWDPVGFAGQPAFLPLNVGNPNLGPERSAEIEFGFDGGFLQDRLKIEFTSYNKTVHEALLNVSQIPSQGFGGSQLENVGKLSNKGLEIGISGDVIRASEFVWNLGVDITTNKTKILDLGSAAASNDLRLGKPWPLVTGTKLTNPDDIAEPIYVTNYEFGPNSPTRTIKGDTHLQLPGGISLSARGEYQAGHFITVGGATNTMTRTAWPACEPAGNNGYEMIRQGRRAELTALVRAICTASPFPSNFPRVRQDYFSLRELSLRLPVDRFMPGPGGASVTFSARNWYNWLNSDFDWVGFHPESFGRPADGLNALSTSIPEQIPPPKTFVTSLRFTF